MNLIEQLGGYENAKVEFKALKNQPELYKGEHAANDILLLQYRRTNNIFEVGDLVVYFSNIAPEHNDIYLVKECFSDSCFVVEDGADYRAFYDYIRHATPEEIKAGKRL